MHSATIRWTVLLTLLSATVGAMLYPLEEAETPRRTRTPRSQKPAEPVTAQAATAVADDDRANVDPFAPRGWQAAPVVPAAVATVAVPEFVGPQRPPPPPSAPPLPFQYMGSFSDGGALLVYLSHGEQTLIARPGETLESVYKIQAMTAQKIDFLHLPTGEKQSMNLPAPN